MSEALTVSVEEAGRLLGISRGLAYELVRRGDIPALRLGRRFVVPRRALYAGRPSTALNPFALSDCRSATRIIVGGYRLHHPTSTNGRLMATCARCNGSGKCTVCDGRGKTGAVFSSDCIACTPKGSGNCSRCKGSGHT